MACTRVSKSVSVSYKIINNKRFDKKDSTLDSESKFINIGIANVFKTIISGDISSLQFSKPVIEYLPTLRNGINMTLQNNDVTLGDKFSFRGLRLFDFTTFEILLNVFDVNTKKWVYLEGDDTRPLTFEMNESVALLFREMLHDVLMIFGRETDVSLIHNYKACRVNGLQSLCQFVLYNFKHDVNFNRYILYTLATADYQLDAVINLIRTGGAVYNGLKSLPDDEFTKFLISTDMFVCHGQFPKMVTSYGLNVNFFRNRFVVSDSQNKLQEYDGSDIL